jgi:hypothetical protein
MKLRDLESITPSNFLPAKCFYTDAVPTLADKLALSDRDVARAAVSLEHEGQQVTLDIWVVVNSEALVLVGPAAWLPGGVPCFCRGDQDLCDLLVCQMEEVWGTANFDTGDPAQSLDVMCRIIPRISTSPSVARTPPLVLHPLETNLDLE